MSHDDALAGFTRSVFEHDGDARAVYSAGAGPAVIVIHEIPGLHPGVIDFGQRVVERGFHVRMPSLFGTPGKPFGVGYTIRSLTGACVAREFTNWALNETSPIIGWLRALAADAHETCGGPGVGAVGMCFTGGFALAMMVDERMQAPVLSQPSLPFPGGRRRKAATGISDADLARVKERAAAGACVMGLRFSEDRAVPEARFDTLRRELGDAFLAVEIDSSKGNPDGIKRRAHSVLTLDLVDEPGHPTRAALDGVLAFLEKRLRP
ncbi:MAG TPA: dienelactone hydrolase family protein [Acidimicrobiia bacterium]|nr:dienelactone hydrolase family protein [Acidimicrobiia bacterium]